MAYTYITINEDGIATGYSSLSGEVIKDDLIPVEAGFDWQNKKWNGESWEEYEPEIVEVEEEPSQLDEIQANLDYLVIMTT